MMAASEKKNLQMERHFFGRRAGKSLNQHQAALMETRLSAYEILLDDPCPSALEALFCADVRAVWIESGFGGGEHLIHRAQENPDIGYIGIEPFRNGMAKALSDIERLELKNIRLFYDVAALLLDWLPKASIDGFYLLYPDPWPKTRHLKRRFVSPENLDRIARVLKPQGAFRFASDIDSYVSWTLDQCARHANFETISSLKDDKVLLPWQNWPGTRYEEKAIKAGRTPRYLTFRRR